MTNKPHPLRGYLYIATATFLWGISATMGRAVFTGRLTPGGRALHAIDPLILAQSRTTFSLLVLFPILWAVRGRHGLAMPKKDILSLVLLGVLGVAASNYLYYLAIQKTNVATAIILQYTAPVWVLLYTVARGVQKVTAQRVIAVGLALTGIVLVIGIRSNGGLHLDKLGVLAAMLASFSFAFYNIAGHDILARYDRWRVLTYTLASAAAFWIVFNPPWKIAAAHYGWPEWIFMIVFAITSVLLPFSMYFAGLQHLDATSAIVGSCLEPVFSIIIAAVVLAETVRPTQTIGILVVLAAIVLAQTSAPGERENSAVVQPIE